MYKKSQQQRSAKKTKRKAKTKKQSHNRSKDFSQKPKTKTKNKPSIERFLSKTNKTKKIKYQLVQTKGSVNEGYVMEADQIRAALLVLVQHSIVEVKCIDKQNDDVFEYRIDVNRCRLFPRYSAFMAHAKLFYGPMGSAIVEELLVAGRLRTEDVIQHTYAVLKQKREEATEPATEQQTSSVKVEDGIKTEETSNDEMTDESQLDPKDEKLQK